MDELQYFVPMGYEPVDTWCDPDLFDLCFSLAKGFGKWVPVPNSILELRSILCPDGVGLDFRKWGEIIFINHLCLGRDQFASVFRVVKEIYEVEGLGVPQLPSSQFWIHSVPCAGHLVEPGEVLFCHRLTVGFFMRLMVHWDENLARMN